MENKGGIAPSFWGVDSQNVLMVEWNLEYLKVIILCWTRQGKNN